MKLYLKAYFHWTQLLRILLSVLSFMSFHFAFTKNNIVVQFVFMFLFLYFTYTYVDAVKHNISFLKKEKEKSSS
jgi:hypothetical protein